MFFLQRQKYFLKKLDNFDIRLGYRLKVKLIPKIFYYISLKFVLLSNSIIDNIVFYFL